MFDREVMFNRVMLSAWFTDGMMMMGFVVIMPFTPLYVRELGASDPSAIVFWSGAVFGAFGVLSTARAAGVVLGPVIGDVMVQLAGLRDAFVATGLLLILIALWVGLAIERGRRPRAQA